MTIRSSAVVVVIAAVVASLAATGHAGATSSNGWDQIDSTTGNPYYGVRIDMTSVNPYSCNGPAPQCSHSNIGFQRIRVWRDGSTSDGFYQAGWIGATSNSQVYQDCNLGDGTATAFVEWLHINQTTHHCQLFAHPTDPTVVHSFKVQNQPVSEAGNGLTWNVWIDSGDKNADANIGIGNANHSWIGGYINDRAAAITDYCQVTPHPLIDKATYAPSGQTPWQWVDGPAGGAGNTWTTRSNRDSSHDDSGAWNVPDVPGAVIQFSPTC